MNNKRTIPTYWIIGGSAVMAGSIAAYFLFFHKKKKPEPNRNYPTRKTTQPSGGVQAGTGNKGAALPEPNWKDPFDMHYEEDVKKWVAPKKIIVLGEQDAQAMAVALYKAKGATWISDDDEEAVKEVFQKRLRDKVQVANLSRAFWKKYKKDLWEYLNGFLNSREMEAYVQKPVRSLPNYTLIK